jgi:hypothetical protein
MARYMRAGTTGEPTPYEFFGTFAGLSFWPGGLTLIGAAPGIGKTSWILRMVTEASEKVPAALCCYEHTVEELRYRQRCQAMAKATGAHEEADPLYVESELARGGEVVLMELDDDEDTVRGIESWLLRANLPERGNALVAMDRLECIPVMGISGLVPPEQRGAAAAAALHRMARKHGWAIVATVALKDAYFEHCNSLAGLYAGEEAGYEADRVLVLGRNGHTRDCGCVTLEVVTLKDRVDATRTWQLEFWGERFFPALPGEIHE